MKKRLKWIIAILLLSAVSSIVIANMVIERATNNLVYNDVNQIPYNKVGLLLGTSKHISSGLDNQYFTYRIDATVELFKAHKIDYVVVSGDNSRADYNEPLDMKNDLLSRGIPEERIYLDHAGFRTYDSIIRMNKIFGQQQFTIISQEFHNRRALYTAQYLGLQTVAFNAKDVTKYGGFKTKLREKFSRVKLFIDLWTQKQAHFLGEPVVIP